MTDNEIDLIDREEIVFRDRLCGKSIRRIASEHHLSIESVKDIIQRQSPVIDNRLRLITLALELERLDAMQDAFYRAAVNGDPQAAAIMLRVQERRAAYLALDCGLRTDPRPLPVEAAPNPDSMSQLIAALDAVANEGKKPVSDLQLVTGTGSDLPPEDPPTPPAEPAA